MAVKGLRETWNETMMSSIIYYTDRMRVCLCLNMVRCVSVVLGDGGYRRGGGVYMSSRNKSPTSFLIRERCFVVHMSGCLF